MSPHTRGAALALGLALTLGPLAGCGDDTEPAPGGTGAGVDPSTPSPSSATTQSGGSGPTSATTSEPATDTDAEADTEIVPVYFTGETPLGQRLYPELREVGADDPLGDAAALLVAGDALDPDYGTLLRGVTIDGVAADDGALVVTLAEDSVTTADKSLSPADARIAVQSLVYTLQGVAQTRDPIRVVLADGTPVDLLDQRTAKGVKAAMELAVRSLVSIGEPDEGATVSGPSMTLEGVASSFEATVPYFVTDADGTKVAQDFTTAEGWADKLYPFTADVDLSGLEPGDYTLHVRTDDPSGGEGPGPFEDTRGFTLQ